MDNNLEPVRHGEEDIPEIREKNPLPTNDQDRLKFRDEITNDMSKQDLPIELREKFDMLMKMHHLEMMTRMSFANQLHNRELVFQAFNKDFPFVKLEHFVKEGEPHYDTVKKIHTLFVEDQSTILKQMEAATEHFNRSCKTLREIEKLQEDKTKPADESIAAGQILLQDLIDLHKGNTGTERRWY